MAKTSKMPVISGTKKHKIMSVLALAGLYVCGLLTGLGLDSTYVKIPKAPDLTKCEKIEILLQKKLIDNPTRPEHYINNIDTLKTLSINGCDENMEKYRKLRIDEMEILSVLYPDYKKQTDENKNIVACEKTEEIILDKIFADNISEPVAQSYISDAANYIRLVKTGCPENRDIYKVQARRALEIATSISRTANEQKQIVRLYKELAGIDAATQAIEVIKGIAYPTIEFVLELERIANEHQ